MNILMEKIHLKSQLYWNERNKCFIFFNEFDIIFFLTRLYLIGLFFWWWYFFIDFNFFKRYLKKIF